MSALFYVLITLKEWQEKYNNKKASLFRQQSASSRSINPVISTFIQNSQLVFTKSLHYWSNPLHKPNSIFT